MLSREHELNTHEEVVNVIIHAKQYNNGISIHYDSRMSPDLSRGTGKSIGGDLDVDDEGSEQRRFEPVQSLHHGSIGYQSVHTQIGLAKNDVSLLANQEHKQDQERTISNCR
jgi:hypothetical protein